MKKYFHQFFFGTSLNDNKVMNAGWLLFRLHIGLSIAIHAGWPKMNTLAAPGWFNDQVAGLGFTLPSPAFWATLASWGEFAGGIGIALGLLTRFNALQLAFQFFIISFMWYDTPEPLTGMYFQQTLFWSFVLVTFAGGGRYSLDKLIMRGKMITIPLPVKTAMLSLLFFTSFTAKAQRKPLKGSGTVITQTFDFKNFDKLEILDLNGKINVETGKAFSILVSIDDNLASLLKVTENDGELRIELQGNEYNKMYIENTNINITICLPEVSVVKHRSNSKMVITGIMGRYFKLRNTGNGDVRLSGSIDQLDLICQGNGDVDAKGLMAQSVKIQKSGNGDVLVMTDNTFSATGSGNGDVINKGEGVPDTSSKMGGNGKIVYRNQPQQNYIELKKVKIEIINETQQRIELTIKYPGRGSYGIDVKPGMSVKESLPVGTTIYKSSQSADSANAVYKVTEEKKQVFVYKNQNDL
jgi:uncharacterized membrane protein YphA (DoxX/SURF4 family)